MTSSGPQSSDSAASIAVPAVFFVLMKMNLCACDTIIASFRPLLGEPDGEVLEDGAEMNLRHAQRRGDILQLLALLSGDAVVRKQRQIGGADDLLLRLPVKHRRRRRQLSEDR